MDYRLLYKAANNYEAYFIQGLLKNNLIKSQLLGENLSVGIGELPIDVIQVDILVPKNKLNESIKIISDYEKNLKYKENKIEWICKDCKEINPENFGICWNCNK